MARLILPPADWRARAGLADLCSALEADRGEARFVGGVVRDTLLGLAVHDIDIATRLTPDAVLARLKHAAIKAVPTGLAHGTITAVLPDGPVEVTTLRRDVSTDGRHATVAYSTDWQEDAARRDFTINALYADPASGAIHDYFGGLDDLAARRVRFIGDPFQRIAEDHLRILRFFRFQARFGETPDADALDACRRRANDLMALSRERIADELLKLLVAARAPAIVALMIDQAIFHPVLPELADAARLARVAALEQALSLPADPVRRLAALLPDDPAIGDAIGARLRLSNAIRKRLTAALGSEDLGPPRAMAYRLGTQSAIDRLILDVARSGEGDQALAGRVAAILDWTPPRLPISGGMLVARGITKGPDVARLLHRIENQWVAEDFPDAARVMAIADAQIDQALRSRSSA